MYMLDPGNQCSVGTKKILTFIVSITYTTDNQNFGIQSIYLTIWFLKISWNNNFQRTLEDAKSLLGTRQL